MNQTLHGYNHCRVRFEVDDRKGLEIVMLTALMTFNDSNDGSSPSIPSQTPTSRRISILGINTGGGGGESSLPPAPPPKPAPRLGLERIAEVQAQAGDYNEVIVDEEGDINDYAAYCNQLLQVTSNVVISPNGTNPGSGRCNAVR